MNHQNFERTLRFRVIPGSMLVGVSAQQPSPNKKVVTHPAVAVVSGRRPFCKNVVVPRSADSQLFDLIEALSCPECLSRLSQIAPLSRAGVVPEDRLVYTVCVFHPDSCRHQQTMSDLTRSRHTRWKSLSEKSLLFPAAQQGVVKRNQGCATKDLPGRVLSTKP